MTKKNNKRPDFFIVGAPKSATTFMHRCLRLHPDIFMPRRKEVHYFGSDLIKIPNEFFVLNERSYLDLFRNAKPGQLIGESSVMYLFSKTAAWEIKAFNPDARVIIMLRNPVDMLYAYHSQLYWGAYEDIPDFAEALAAESDRRQGRRMPRFANMPNSLLYREVGEYSAQVQRYLDAFGRDRVHIVIFDDFLSDPLGEYQRALRFLGVNPDVRPEIRQVNPNKYYRSRMIQEFVARPPWPARLLLRLIPSEWRFLLLGEIANRNTTFRDRPRMPAAVRQDLCTHYREDVQNLGRLLNRDLSHWTQAGMEGDGPATDSAPAAPQPKLQTHKI